MSQLKVRVKFSLTIEHAHCVSQTPLLSLKIYSFKRTHTLPVHYIDETLLLIRLVLGEFADGGDACATIRDGGIPYRQWN